MIWPRPEAQGHKKPQLAADCGRNEARGIEFEPCLADARFLAGDLETRADQVGPDALRVHPGCESSDHCPCRRASRARCPSPCPCVRGSARQAIRETAVRLSWGRRSGIQPTLCTPSSATRAMIPSMNSSVIAGMIGEIEQCTGTPRSTSFPSAFSRFGRGSAARFELALTAQDRGWSPKSPPPPDFRRAMSASKSAIVQHPVGLGGDGDGVTCLAAQFKQRAGDAIFRARNVFGW